MAVLPDVMINEGARTARNVLAGGGAVAAFFSFYAFAAGNGGSGFVLALIAGAAFLIAGKIKYRYRLKGGAAIYE